MQITHVIRGDDHVNNTPRQINMFRALGATPPSYAHVPTVLGEDGAKLSKRHGAVSVMEYEAAGYLPDAMVNFLARIGWAHGDDELFSRAQLVEWFTLEGISPAPSRFNLGKLNWVNQEHMKRMPEDDLGAHFLPLPRARRAGRGERSRPRQGRGALARPRGNAGRDGRRGFVLLCDAERRRGQGGLAGHAADPRGARSICTASSRRSTGRARRWPRR